MSGFVESGGRFTSNPVAAFDRIWCPLSFESRILMTDPDNHDREVAVVQGLTHLIANVLDHMGPLPTRLTTTSFDLLLQATEMVRHDAISVFLAIERENPYAASARERFFALAEETKLLLEDAE